MAASPQVKHYIIGSVSQHTELKSPWSLHFPDNWLNSQLRLPVRTAKTTAVDFLRKLNGDQAKCSCQQGEPLCPKADPHTENHIPQVPAGGGEGRKPLLPTSTSFQKSHRMASPAPWCDKEMTISVESIQSSGRGGWRVRRVFLPREAELNS